MISPLNPLMMVRVLPQLNNVATVFRGILRNSSEDLGLGVTVPQSRKGDYLFRDIYIPVTLAYWGELTYRVIEQMFITPNFRRYLDLDHWASRYQPKDPLTPAFARNLKINPIVKFPKAVSDALFGSVNDPQSIYLAPKLLENEDIPKLQARLDKLGAHTPQGKAIQQEINDVRLIAHHVRRTFDPIGYIDHYLLPQNLLSHDEANLLKTALHDIDKYGKLFQKAKEEAVGAKVNRSATPVYRTMGGKLESYRPLDYRKSSSLKALRAQFGAWVEKHPSLKEHGLIKELMPLSTQELGDALRGPSLLQSIRNMGGVRSGYKNWSQPFYTDESLIKRVTDEVLIPILNVNLEGHVRSGDIPLQRIEFLDTLIKDFSQNVGKVAHVQKIFRSSDLFLKIPLSIAGMFVLAGLIANHFDSQFLQPFQREIVKKRGNARDFIAPTYLSLLPGAAVFLGLMRLRPIQNLGYIKSFALSGFAGLATVFSSGAFMFLNRLSRPQPPSRWNDSEDQPKPSNSDAGSRAKSVATPPAKVIMQAPPLPGNLFVRNQPPQPVAAPFTPRPLPR